MGPLWKEIMANILPILDPAHHSTDTPPPKLALFSGHDTTLMPLLATLGERVWPGTEWAPYASMILIEIHNMTNVTDRSQFRSGYGFRLIYNGNVLTAAMDGCDKVDICDAQVLLDQVMPFAKHQERDCSASMTPETTMKEIKEATESLVAAPGGVWIIGSFMLLSMALGGVLTLAWIKRGRHKTRGYMQKGTAEINTANPGTHHSVSATYGATNEDKSEFNENTLI